MPTEAYDKLLRRMKRGEDQAVGQVKARVEEVLKAREEIIQGCLDGAPKNDGLIQAKELHDTLAERIMACFE